MGFPAGSIPIRNVLKSETYYESKFDIIYYIKLRKNFLKDIMIWLLERLKI